MKVLRKVWSVVTWMVLIVVVAFLIVSIICKITNIKSYTVSSGSMEPNLPTGSLIYIKQTKPSDLKIGDVITFKLTETKVATHRIIGIEKEGNTNKLKFETKGDSNKDADVGFVPEYNVEGKMIFSIPYVGYILVFIKSFTGIMLLILILLITLLLNTLDNMKDKKQNKESKCTNEILQKS